MPHRLHEFFTIDGITLSHQQHSTHTSLKHIYMLVSFPLNQWNLFISNLHITPKSPSPKCHGRYEAIHLEVHLRPRHRKCGWRGVLFLRFLNYSGRKQATPDLHTLVHWLLSDTFEVLEIWEKHCLRNPHLQPGNLNWRRRGSQVGELQPTENTCTSPPPPCPDQGFAQKESKLLTPLCCFLKQQAVAPICQHFFSCTNSTLIPTNYPSQHAVHQREASGWRTA